MAIKEKLILFVLLGIAMFALVVSDGQIAPNRNKQPCNPIVKLNEEGLSLRAPVDLDEVVNIDIGRLLISPSQFLRPIDLRFNLRNLTGDTRQLVLISRSCSCLTTVNELQIGPFDQLSMKVQITPNISVSEFVQHMTYRDISGRTYTIRIRGEFVPAVALTDSGFRQDSNGVQVLISASDSSVTNLDSQLVITKNAGSPPISETTISVDIPWLEVKRGETQEADIHGGETISEIIELEVYPRDGKSWAEVFSESLPERHIGYIRVEFEDEIAVFPISVALSRVFSVAPKHLYLVKNSERLSWARVVVHGDRPIDEPKFSENKYVIVELESKDPAGLAYTYKVTLDGPDHSLKKRNGITTSLTLSVGSETFDVGVFIY